VDARRARRALDWFGMASTMHAPGEQIHARDWLVLPATLAQEREFRGSVDHVGWRNLAIGWRLAGQLDPGTVERTLQVIAGRHEALRSGLAEVHDEVVQLVAPRVALQFDVIDLANLAGRARGRRLRRSATLSLRTPFVLTDPPLWRATLYRLGPVDHVLMFVVSHTIWDAYSSIVFAEELRRVYRSLALGVPLDLEALSAQLGDIAQWERAVADPEAEAFWANELSAGPRRVPLPIERDRAAARHYRGEDIPLARMPRWVGRSLQALAETEGTTLAVTFLAAFALLLRGGTRQDRVVIGLDEANRDRPETRGMIGYLLNVLPICVRLDRCATFRDVVLIAKSAVADAYAHRLPLRRLAAITPPGEPLYETTLNVRPHDRRLAPSLRGGRALFTPVPWTPPRAWANFEVASVWWDAHLDLSLDVDGSGAIAGEVSYDTEAIERDLAQRLVEELQSLLRRVARFPDRELARLLGSSR
jgi:hypothetical protein